MESVLNWSVIISIIGVLVVLTNIVVQVLKKVTWDKLAMIVSLVLTLGAFFAYCSIKGIAVVWYWYADSFVEIGKLLGITEGNARLRLTRMRKQLKTYLTEQEVLV